MHWALPKPFERQIIHFDGDSFFASVEQVLDYRLKGKPLVTGGERGAITSASIEAKRAGINRGIPMHMAKEMCPGLKIVNGDYLSYSIFAHRMYAIVREFADEVEEYSIDECFADITGLDMVYNKSYEEIGRMIKEKLETSLGITFGVGLGPTKVLAKVASKHRKPAGFTVITPENLKSFLHTLPVGGVWGIGPSSSRELQKLGITSAHDLATKPLSWVEGVKLAKPYRETWLELQGISVREISLDHDSPQSIIVSRTFSPPTTDKESLLSELSKNVEAACAKARRHKMRPKEVRFYLKTQAFTYHGLDLPLLQASSSPTEIMRLVVKYFNDVYKARTLYRATGISLKKFKEDVSAPDLFGATQQTEKQQDVFKAIDMIGQKYGEHTVHLGSSLKARKFREEIHEKPLDLPFLGVAK